jgi:spermidine/putrescine transport system ATP-binding protein
VTGVGKRFGSVTALSDVSLTVASGEFVTILGPSGCGKTTLLRIIAGLETADTGRVALGGAEVTHLPANRRPVNTVFQSYALFPHLDVFENIAFGLRARKFAAPEVDRRVHAALEMLHLDEMQHRRTFQLSGGQKQRVALARALVNEPDVLLLDEPMSALDAKLRSEVQLELRRLQRRLGKTFVLVTHDQNEAMTVSDRIFVMREARIVQSGPPSEVYDRPVNRFVAEFLGTTNMIPAWRNNGSVHTDMGTLAPRAHPSWQRGALCIRPERILVRAAKPESNGVRAIVSEVIYRGDHIDVFVQPGSLHLRSSPSASLKPGQQVWLELPSRHLEALGE